jgi:hypothetical protein
LIKACCAFRSEPSASSTLNQFSTTEPCPYPIRTQPMVICRKNLKL